MKAAWTCASGTQRGGDTAISPYDYITGGKSSDSQLQCRIGQVRSERSQHQNLASSSWWCSPRPSTEKWAKVARQIPEGPDHPVSSHRPPRWSI